MSARQRYAIRPLNDTEADRRAQSRFLAEACPPDDSLIRDAARRKWQYVDNPRSRGRPTVWAFSDDHRILGQLGTIPVTLSAAGHSYAAAWCVDFVVHADFRNRGVGPLLLREVATEFDLLLGLGTNEFSYPFFKKAKWTDLGSLPCYVKILDARALLARMLPAVACRFLAPTANLLLRGSQRRATPTHREVLISPAGSFGSEFDALWDRLASRYAFAVRRDHAYLNWKYVAQPRMRYVGFRADRDGQLRGYVVVRKARDPFVPYGTIVDLVSEPDDRATMEALLQAAVDYLRGDGATYVRCHTSQEQSRLALRRLGFMERPSHSRFMVSALPGQGRGRDGAGCLDHWLLMAGDGDLDRVPLPEDA